MARVTQSEVLAIMGNPDATNISVDTYILAANEIVNKVFAGDTLIGDVLLKEIERWFTAHMLASTVFRQTIEEKIGDAADKYAGKFGENLSFTSYGQMVLQLDITGKMVNYVGKRPVRIYAIKSFD